MAPLDYLDYWLNSIHAHAAENTALIENGVTVGSAKRGTKSDCDTGEKEGGKGKGSKWDCDTGEKEGVREREIQNTKSDCDTGEDGVYILYYP